LGVEDSVMHFEVSVLLSTAADGLGRCAGIWVKRIEGEIFEDVIYTAVIHHFTKYARQCFLRVLLAKWALKIGVLNDRYRRFRITKGEPDARLQQVIDAVQSLTQGVKGSQS